MKLKGGTSPWIHDTRPKDGTFWENDYLLKLPGMGTITVDRINEIDSSIKVVKDLFQTNSPVVLSIRGIQKFILKSKDAKKGSCPYLKIDHYLQPNQCHLIIMVVC